MNDLLINKFVDSYRVVQPQKTGITEEQISRIWDSVAFVKCEGYVFDECAKTIRDKLFNMNGKGYCFYGRKGIGKTFNLDIYKEILSGMLFRVKIEAYEAMEIETLYKDHGAKILLSLAELPCLIINDIGTESDVVNDYGTHRNIIADLLYLRYRKFQLKKSITHVTCNPAVKLEQRYGDRLYDRMKEMFEFVELTGQSRRK